MFQNNTNSFGSTDGTVTDGSGLIKYTTFGGVPVAKNDVLVKYTYYGDTDLDGKITAGDYTNIDLYAHQQRSAIKAWVGPTATSTPTARSPPAGLPVD